MDTQEEIMNTLFNMEMVDVALKLGALEYMNFINNVMKKARRGYMPDWMNTSDIAVKAATQVFEKAGKVYNEEWNRCISEQGNILKKREEEYFK